MTRLFSDSRQKETYSIRSILLSDVQVVVARMTLIRSVVHCGFTSIDGLSTAALQNCVECISNFLFSPLRNLWKYVSFLSL